MKLITRSLDVDKSVMTAAPHVNQASNANTSTIQLQLFTLLDLLQGLDFGLHLLPVAVITSADPISSMSKAVELAGTVVFGFDHICFDFVSNLV